MSTEVAVVEVPPMECPAVMLPTPANMKNMTKQLAAMPAKLGALMEVQAASMAQDEVDKLTGPIMGRPKSATFRTCDVVGLDTLVHVSNGLKANCPNDERKEVFEIPAYVSSMLENNWLGSKSGQGFYKKTTNEKGKKTILELDLKTLEYTEKKKIKFQTKLKNQKG